MAHLAPYKPETANCTIVIPVPRRASSPRSPVLRDTSKSPDVDSPSRITLHLHREYLSSKSLFLRALFSGASLLELIQTLCASQPHSPPIPLRIPRSRLPRLLPSPPSHPVIFLPVPDPFSIQPLFHWVYFGHTHEIEKALDRGDIHWEGLARNVEYLGLSTDIKIFLGRWYRTWYLPSQCSTRSSPCPADDDDESDWDSGSDLYHSPASLLSDDDDEGEDEEEL